MPPKHLRADNQDLWAACQQHGIVLDGLITHQDRPVPGAHVLWTISGLESSFGDQALYVRHEPAFMPPGGIYWKRSQTLQRLYYRYGVLAACSYGAFQVMFITAYEMGFNDHPIKLQDHDLCAMMAARLIRRRFIDHQHAKTINAIFDAYNSGNWHDAAQPLAYIHKGIGMFDLEFDDGVDNKRGGVHA